MGKPMGFTGNFGTCFEGPKFFLRYLIMLDCISLVAIEHPSALTSLAIFSPDKTL